MSDFNEFFGTDPDRTGKISSTTAQLPKGITCTALSKILNVKEDVVQRSLYQMAKLYQQGMANELSKRLSTSNRMLR